jgi:hypothetical protein
MTCTNCGDAPLAMEYTLRFTPEERKEKLLELHLCQACLQEICADPAVELVSDGMVPTAD